MCFGSYPNPTGHKIASLNEGDEIKIKGKEGQPDVITYIWIKDGYSALTASGESLSCQSDVEFEPTGNHADTFEISDTAQKIWDELQNCGCDPSFEFDFGDPDDLLD